MSDSSSDDSDAGSPNSDYIFYKDRAEWRDVTPIPQDDGPHPVVAIAYSEKFKDVSDYMRAVMKAGEMSRRALELTTDMLEMNPANYTIWQYRRDIIKHLGANLKKELQYTENMIVSQPKNYQLWQHRQTLVSWADDPSREFDLTELVLYSDAKNYHAWQHRQWVMITFRLWDQELSYIEQMLEEDVRNNSAWNQRYFVVSSTTGFTPEVIERELAYTIDKIKLVKNNESPWNYLRGVIVHTPSGNLSSEPCVRKFCEELYAEGVRSPFLVGTLIDMCAEQVEMGRKDDTLTVERAVQMCSELASVHDKIRREYWHYIMRRLMKRGLEVGIQNSPTEEPMKCPV